MNSDIVKIRQLLSLLNRHKKAIVSIVGITIGFAISLSFIIQKQFKSQFEINVYSKYFQNPLISAIVPGVYNIPEMRFTIDSMVKEAISDDYIDQVAGEFEIYQLDASEAELAKNRQFLRNRFQYYSTGGQSYRVTFQDSDPYRAKKIAKKTLDRVKGHFIDTRIATIEVVKSIMLERLQALSASQKLGASGTEKALASRSPEALRGELNKIEASISALSKQYNMNHPRLQELVMRRKTVSSWLEEFKEDLGAVHQTEGAIAIPSDKHISGELTGKFFTKYHDFNMALDIEKRSLESYLGVIERPQLPTAATWPKKRLFGMLGFILGFVFAFLYVFVREVVSPSKLEFTRNEAKDLGGIFLGEYRAGHVDEIILGDKKSAVSIEFVTR